MSQFGNYNPKINFKSLNKYLNIEDLRIGNIVSIDGHIQVICDNIVFDYDEGDWYVDDRHISLVKPILITEENITPLGFKCIDSNDDHLYYNNETDSTLDRSFQPNFVTLNYTLEYIHQLQNLYYCVFGLELTNKQL